MTDMNDTANGQSVANPRRLRLGRDGRPLPQQPRDDEGAAAG